jgi:hypothetical protein
MSMANIICNPTTYAVPRGMLSAILMDVAAHFQLSRDQLFKTLFP